MAMTQETLSYIDAHRQEAFELLVELAQIPAPSHQEQRRAEFIRHWLHRNGAEGAYIDEALNVVYPIGVEEGNPLMVFMAHSDVVFPDTDPLPLTISDGKIHCPGVGDDTANVVALLLAAKYLAEQKLVPQNCGVLLVVNSCEEGLGNLKGCRKIMDTFGHRVQEFVSFDCGPHVVITQAVGSRRYRVEVDTVGGHSFANFGNPNAIACLAALIDELYRVRVHRTTYNVGTISGGTSVNTIAQHAQMLYEFRSDHREALEAMEETFQNIVSEHRAKGLDITVTLLGERPCSGNVDEYREQALAKRATEAIQRHYGIKAQLGFGSTDCNVPLAMGIPAVCVGCVIGSGAHTREEYIEINSLQPGLALAMDMILHHF